MREEKHGHLSLQAKYSVGCPKKQGNLCLCSGSIQGGQVGRGGSKGILTYQEILFISENCYTKDGTCIGGEITAASLHNTETKGAFNGDVLHIF